MTTLALFGKLAINHRRSLLSSQSAWCFLGLLIWHAGIAIAEQPSSINLIDGELLDGWNVHLVDEGVAKEDVWSVNEGVLICQGTPLGYLATKQKYRDFILELDWRWAVPETKSQETPNSGVLLRIAAEPPMINDSPSFMAKCVEAQLMSGSAGDIWAFYGFEIHRKGERAKTVNDHEVLGDFYGYGAMRNVEHKLGQWNRYEIKLQGDSLTLKINGELVNQASGLQIVEGPIGLQSEGAEIHFRNIKLTPLN